MKNSIVIIQSNSTCGSKFEAKDIDEAKKIVKELINEETVSITIKQKEWDKGNATRAFSL
ncbi:MAG: hypothetical protein LKJ03_07335 [Enterococcaceae bacterium]|jgi:hypothetical protein|nr:hypothetical protein [Enterococcaceae bacterium]